MKEKLFHKRWPIRRRRGDITSATALSTVVSSPNMMEIDPNEERVGHIDFFRDGQVVGWVFDPEEAAPLVKVFVDDVCVNTIVCDEDRRDVVDAGYPDSARGFRCNVPAEYFNGDRHELKVTLIDGTPLAIATDYGLKTSLQFRSSFNPDFIGHLDGITGDLVTGWILAGNVAGSKMSGRVKLAVYCDGVMVGQLRADDSRPDVGEAHGAESACGFSFQIPSRYLRTKTTVEVSTFPHRWVLPGSPVVVEQLPSTERGRLRVVERNLEHLAVELWRIRREVRALTKPPKHATSARCFQSSFE